MAQDVDENKKITEALYEHNLELSVKNRTLLLLEKLYQTSILTLAPETMAHHIADVIRQDLNLEFAGVLMFDKEKDTLNPLAFSKSQRLMEILKRLGFLFRQIPITTVSKRTFLQKIIFEQKKNLTNNIAEVWGELISLAHIEEIKNGSHIKTMMGFPLLSGADTLGILIIGLNRDYESLNTFEKASIESFTNVIALSLDKVYLYKNLQDANESLKNLIKQRESLVHLVTHKVKGSFTRSKYIFAEMIAGGFGELPPLLKKIAGQGLESDKEGIDTVDLVLNASNLQTGTVKFNMQKMDFKKIVEEIITDKKGPAEAKGLKFENEIQAGEYFTQGDPFWLKEVVHNLVDNSVKYTKQGSIKIGLLRENGKIKFFVKDTGVGITDEDKKNLFKEGGRGKDSVKVNVDSTGYGLFTVKLIMDAHKGKIWAESEGANKGSTFWMELDLAKT